MQWNPFEKSNVILHRNRENNLKIQVSWTDKETVDKMNSSGGIPIFDSKLYYRASVNKVLWHWYQNRNQRDGIEYRIQLQSGFPDFFFFRKILNSAFGERAASGNRAGKTAHPHLAQWS